MPEGGVLTLNTDSVTGNEIKSAPTTVDPTQQYLRISVRDTGTGMSEQVRRRIFEPFFTTKDVNRGTGLGLAVVYGIVKNHNGSIMVESEIGHGTLFTLLFPVFGADTQNNNGLIAITEDGLRGNETILLVEDEEEVRTSLMGNFESKGYRVYTAEDGISAVELYAKHQSEIAVVLLNLGLPKLSGMEAFLRMHKLNPSILCILCSGYIDPTLREAAMNCGIKGFIEKPFVADEVVVTIRRILRDAGHTVQAVPPQIL